MFYKMSNLKESIRLMPKAIERNDQHLLNHIHRLVLELLMHLDEEKKEKDRAKRKNAQPIVEEIDSVLKKYRINPPAF
jgi:predicted nucleotidyltransferase